MRFKLYVMLVFVAIFMGAAFNLASYAVHYFPAPGAAALRFVIAALLILGLLFMKERMSVTALKANWPMYVLLGVLGVFGFNLLMFEGMKTTSPLNGSLIMATNPLVAAVLARFIIKDTISVRQSVGILFSLLGVLLVITQGSWQVISTLSFSSGDLLMLGGNLCWALYGVLNRRLVRGSSSLATTAYTMIVGAICLLVYAIRTPGPLTGTSIPLSAWGAVAFMAVFTSVLGYLWWNQAIAELGVSKTSVFFNLVPLVTMVLSIASGAQITMAQLLGTALVLSGVVVAGGLFSRVPFRRAYVPAAKRQ